MVFKLGLFSQTMNDSGIFEDGQLSRESSVIQREQTRPETIPPVPGQKRMKTGRANNKKRRKYEEAHIDHNYVLTSLPHLNPDQHFEYLCGSQAEETNGGGVAEPEQGLEAQISSPGLGPEAIEKNEKLMDGEFGDRPMTNREMEEFKRDNEAICNSVMVTERKYTRKEYYIAIMNERAFNGPVIIASSDGGVNIQETAEKNPDAIVKFPIDVVEGLSKEGALHVAAKLGINPAEHEDVAGTLLNLYDLFLTKDASMVEINPYAEDNKGDFVCPDAKLKFDDNAEFRQKSVFDQRDQREVAASEYNPNYIAPEGDIRCMVGDNDARLPTERKLPPNDQSPAVTDKKSQGSTEEKIERIPEKPPKIQAEPDPSFHSAVLKTMPPSEKRKHDPDTSFDFLNQHTEAGFSSDIPQGYVKLKLGTEKLNEKILDVSSKIKEEWASSERRNGKVVVKPKKMNMNKGIVKKKGRRKYSMEDICVAATILYSSKRVYNYLRNTKLMKLPCIRLVYLRLEKFTCPPGKSPQVMRLLQMKLMTLDTAERNVSLSFDEIYLEKKFSYCPRLRQAFKAVKVI